MERWEVVCYTDPRLGGPHRVSVHKSEAGAKKAAARLNRIGANGNSHHEARPVRGRPPEADDGGSRESFIKIRVSPAEKKRVEELAGGPSKVSAYVRSKIL